MSIDDVAARPDLPSIIPHYPGPRPRLDMTGDFRLWQQQVQEALGELRQFGRQESDTGGGPAISFSLAMRKLYGDSHFSAFISSRAWQQAGLDAQIGQELQKLEQQLNAFEEPDSDELLATDPIWQKILAQVAVVIGLLATPGL